MTNKDIQKLIDKYLDGNTSPQEEHTLAQELLRQDLPAEWQAIRLMLGELTMGEAEYDSIMAQRNNKPSAILKAIRIISAVAALYLVGLFLYQQMPDMSPVQDKNEAPHYYTQDLSPGSTLKDVYTSRLRASQKRTISYNQLKTLNYEKK